MDGFALEPFVQNHKFQAPNFKQISNSNIQWPKPSRTRYCLEFSILNIVICLLFDFCYLLFQSFKELPTKQIPSGVYQSRALPPGCKPYGPEAGPGSLLMAWFCSARRPKAGDQGDRPPLSWPQPGISWPEGLLIAQPEVYAQVCREFSWQGDRAASCCTNTVVS